jgi:diacylglycerol kinase family enzyme
LTVAANHGRLWFAVAAIGATMGKRPRRAALRGLVSLSGASLLSNSVIKPLVGRRRPDIERTINARRIGRTPWTSSFPSGHSASAAAFATGAALELPVSAAVLGPLAGAVAYSRVHVGVHYPSDVLVGAAVGVGVGVAGHLLWPAKPYAPAEMAAGSAPPLARGEGLTVVVNAKSGSSDGAPDQIRALLPAAKIVAWDPATDLADTVGTGAQALGVAGGDGTVASVAELALRTDLPLAVFPAGTLNHFAGALGLTDHAATAAVVEAGSAGEVNVATIDGATFLNTAGIGGYPELVRMREKLSHRMGKWPAAAYALYKVAKGHQPMELEINGTPVSVWAVFVGNGEYTPRGLAPSWRDHLADGILDVQFLRADKKYSRTLAVAFSLLGLVNRSTIFGAVQAPRLEIRSLSGPIPTAHDGELTDPVEDIVLQVSPNRLTVYRPD